MSTSDLVDVSNADSIIEGSDAEQLGRVDVPKTAQPLRVYWLYLIPLVILHLMALLAGSL